MKKYKLFINGSWVDSNNKSVDKIINPFDESIVGAVQNASPKDAVAALKAAEKAQKSWRQIPARQRASMLKL